MKQAVIFSFSRRGTETSLAIAAALQEEYECQMYAPQKYASGLIKALPDRIGVFTGTVFKSADALIYVGACGIAVRAIAPYLEKKTVDPAVLCVDECASFCISLLSGHIGGGNRLTRQIAEKIGAAPVVTTATDVNERFAVDEWAARKGFVLGSLAAAKAVSAAILEGDVPFCADAPVQGELPAGLYMGKTGKVGISVSVCQKHPFDITLAVLPPVLTLGIGCRRGISEEAIEEAVRWVFQENHLDLRSVQRVASIDLKAKEQGLLAFCSSHDLPVTFYSAKELSAVQGTFSSSDFVQGVTGVDNVCERSAMALGGKLIVKKTAVNGVTAAVAERDWVVSFG